MARKKGEEEPCGNWMDTYGDMVTLLLTFFIMLYSMSSISEEKWQKLVLAFTNQGKETAQVVTVPEGMGDQMATNQGDVPPPGTGDTLETEMELPQNFDDLYKYLKMYVESNNMESAVSVSQGNGSVYIRFQDSVLFDPDSSVLKYNSNELLDFLGDGLASVEDQILTININGHTAAVPGIENYRISDWRLSSDRASSVAIYMEEQKDIDPQKLLPIGYGKNFPIASNDAAEGRRQNRRVDMLIISKQSSMSSEELLQTLLSGTFDPARYPEMGGSEEILIPEPGQKDNASSQPEVPAPEPLPELPSSVPQDGTEMTMQPVFSSPKPAVSVSSAAQTPPVLPMPTDNAAASEATPASPDNLSGNG